MLLLLLLLLLLFLLLFVVCSVGRADDETVPCSLWIQCFLAGIRINLVCASAVSFILLLFVCFFVFVLFVSLFNCLFIFVFISLFG